MWKSKPPKGPQHGRLYNAEAARQKEQHEKRRAESQRLLLQASETIKKQRLDAAEKHRLQLEEDKKRAHLKSQSKSREKLAITRKISALKSTDNGGGDHDWRLGSNEPYYVWDPHRRIGDADVSRRSADKKRWDGELREPDYLRIHERKLFAEPFQIPRADTAKGDPDASINNHRLTLPPQEEWSSVSDSDSESPTGYLRSKKARVSPSAELSTDRSTGEESEAETAAEGMEMSETASADSASEMTTVRCLFESMNKNPNGQVSRTEMLKAVRKDPLLAERLGIPSTFSQGSEGHDVFEKAFRAMERDCPDEVSWEAFEDSMAGIRERLFVKKERLVPALAIPGIENKALRESNQDEIEDTAEVGVLKAPPKEVEQDHMNRSLKKRMPMNQSRISSLQRIHMEALRMILTLALTLIFIIGTPYDPRRSRNSKTGC